MFFRLRRRCVRGIHTSLWGCWVGVDSFFLYRYAWRWGFPPYNRLTHMWIAKRISVLIWYRHAELLGRTSTSIMTFFLDILWWLDSTVSSSFFGGMSEIRSTSLSNIAWCRSGQPHSCWVFRYSNRVFYGWTQYLTVGWVWDNPCFSEESNRLGGTLLSWSWHACISSVHMLNVLYSIYYLVSAWLSACKREVRGSMYTYLSF